ncbi:MAG: SMC-Scp complex subunit ScpB [Treponemataceae bacterium]
MTDELKLEKETALIDAILYLESQPVSEENLARYSGLSLDVVKLCIENLKEEYSSNTRGIELSQIMGGWLIVPKKDLWEELKDRYGRKNETKLSRAAMETLTLIAYKQPITKAEIEAIRGVSSDGMVRMLMEKELVREVGKKDSPGKPTLYGTTKKFLAVFQLNSIADLPKPDPSEAERFELAR